MDEKTTIDFNIDTQITPSDYTDLVDFIYRNNILPNIQYFTNIVKNVSEEECFIYFTVIDPERRGYIDIQMKIKNPIEVKMVISSKETSEDAILLLRNNLTAAVRLFEEQRRKTTFYFAWLEGEEVTPERVETARKNFIYRMFSESMLLLFILFTAFSILLFMFLGRYAPIALVVLQLIMIIFSDKIIGRIGDWHVTKKNPFLHVFQHYIPVPQYKSFLNKYGKDALIKIKREIYEKTLASGKPISHEACAEVFSQYGLECTAENASIKTMNLYEVVKEAAERFRLPIPKIVVSNTITPNAAASGPWPSRGIILVTTGLLVQLDEKEALSVLGHELSHLKGRDPLILFLLTSLEYLLRFYVFWPLLYISGYLYIFGYFYILFALGIIYFIAKFFESKADLESAIRIGDPKALASALRKIGFRRLQLETTRGYALQEWAGWDPHPPVYFRIARLESLKELEKIKHPLIRSIKDNIHGFLKILG
ncbi:MAG: M48 family metalloprotease [Thermoproteota archaeon]